MERTLVLLKPDCVERGLVGKITSIFEENGLIITHLHMEQAIKEVVMTRLEKHYNDVGQLRFRLESKLGKERSEIILKGIFDYMLSGKIIAMILQGENAVSRVRELVGATDPAKASPYSIRGEFGEDSQAIADDENRAVRNLVHASATVEEAELEMRVWF